jgi:type VI secretion system secreted protein Hcp
MAFDAFLEIKEIPGESTDDAHTDWIEVLSFSHGLSQQSSGSRSSAGGGAAERCNHDDFTIVKALDKASAKLNLACCNGQDVGDVTIELCRAAKDKQTYMKYVMEGVIVTNVRPGGSAQGGEALPLEEVSFNYGKITWTYTETDHKTGAAKGDVETWWDQSNNTGG